MKQSETNKRTAVFCGFVKNIVYFRAICGDYNKKQTHCCLWFPSEVMSMRIKFRIHLDSYCPKLAAEMVQHVTRIPQQALNRHSQSMNKTSETGFQYVPFQRVNRAKLSAWHCSFADALSPARKVTVDRDYYFWDSLDRSRQFFKFQSWGCIWHSCYRQHHNQIWNNSPNQLPLPATLPINEN